MRTEARRLRSTLKAYYEIEGKDDPVFLFFRSGSDAPVFRRQEPDSSGDEAAQVELVSPGALGGGIGAMADCDRSAGRLLRGRSHPAQALTRLSDESCAPGLGWASVVVQQ